MKKLILPVSALSFVCLFGLSINLFFYNIYFSDANYGKILSLAMAVFFILSELVLWAFSDKRNIVAVFLKYSLVIFSVAATLSSQFTATSQKDQQNAEAIYEMTGSGNQVQYYLDQIEKQDEIISQYVRARAVDHVLTLTEDSYNEALATKKEYENMLGKAMESNKEEVSEVFVTKSLYAWFSDDLPELFKNGMNENLVRVIFQLFSSVLLAMMSPVSISTLRKMILNHYEQSEPPTEQETAQAEESKTEEPEQDEVIEITRNSEPVMPRPPTPESPDLTPIGFKNIIRMYKWGWTEYKRWLSTDEVIDHFKRLNDKDDMNLHYFADQCEYVRDRIKDVDMIGLDVDEIAEAVNA